MDMNKLSTGALTSPPEPTAWTLASVGGAVAYPSAAYLDNVLKLMVSMQGTIGCCVGCTFEEIVRLIVLNITGTQEELSWRFVYAMCKALEGTKGYEQFGRTAGANDGTYPALAAQVIRKYGVPLAKYCPNDVTLSPDAFCYGRSLSQIPAAALADAATRRAGADITTPISEAGIKQAVNYARANNGGVAILRSLGEEYWTTAAGVSTWRKGDLFPMRAPKTIESGHEELLYGYVDITPLERSQLQAGEITIESLVEKYPNGTPESAERTETVILWLNHWSAAWGSTSGIKNGARPQDRDGGRGYEFLDIWLPYIREIRVSVAALPEPPESFRYTFTKALYKGDKGPDVVALQHILSLEGCFDYPSFTGNYASVTFAGVKKLQEKYYAEILKPAGLLRGTGNFGGYTRAWANRKYGVIK